MKRFWTDVMVEDGGILLDGRAVRTPARALLKLPTTALADAVADEWRAVGEKIDSRTMPLTGFCNAAIDKVAGDTSGFVAGLATYAETDLLCYRAETPPELVARQAERWHPLLEWAQTRYDVAFVVTAGVIHTAQPSATLTRLGAAITGRSAFELAALSPVVTIGGSLIVALMLAENAITPDAAFDATHLDELWQAELWGEEWMAAEARALRRADFANSGRMLTLLRSA